MNKNRNFFVGLHTALITPFKNGEIDVDSLEKLINLQIDAGVDGIVVGGTTGEGSTISEDDYFHLIRLAVEFAAAKIKVIAGFSAISTDIAVNKISKVEALGVDGLMCSAPSYVRPEQNGLLAHFTALHDSSTTPLMLYLHLGRTGVDFADETIVELSECKRIVAMKDAGSDIERPLRLSRILPENFAMLTGNDSNFVAYSAHGGSGFVSVLSNVFPRECVKLKELVAGGNYQEALVLQCKLLPLHKVMGLESNPIPVKYMASLLGLCSAEIKLPLTLPRSASQVEIEKVLADFKKN